MPPLRKELAVLVAVFGQSEKSSNDERVKKATYRAPFTQEMIIA
jgi:hypothetical protein